MAKKTPEQELLELLEQSQGKHLIATHIADPDGMFSAQEFVNVSGITNYQIIPLEHYLLRDEKVQEALNSRDFYAVLDFPPVGKSIKFFCDHHISNEKIVNEYCIKEKIEHNFFNVKAPSALDELNKLGKKHFDKEVNQDTRAIVNRTDTAKYSTESPTTWDEFWDGDCGWRWVYLIKYVQESPFDFVMLFEKLQTHTADVLIQEEPYNSHCEATILRNMRIKETAEKITPDELTIIIGKDKDVVNRNLMFRLYNGTCKVCTTIASNGDGTYRIGFGTDTAITDTELEPYRCDKLAEELGGGGHARASGCGCTENNLEEVIEFIKNHFKHLSATTIRL